MFYFSIDHYNFTSSAKGMVSIVVSSSVMLIINGEQQHVLIRGEMALRANTFFAVLQYMRSGLSVEEVVYQAVKDFISLKVGLLSDLIVHGIDKNGKYKVVCYHLKPEIEAAPKFYYWYQEGGEHYNWKLLKQKLCLDMMCSE